MVSGRGQTGAGRRGWQPDTNLVDHVRLDGYDIARLSGPDRAWVVAGLTAAGWTAERTAEQLGCSLRLIRQIRSEPMTQVATYALRLRLAGIADAAKAASERRTLENAISALRHEVRSLHRQRERLLRDVTARRAFIRKEPSCACHPTAEQAGRG